MSCKTQSSSQSQREWIMPSFEMPSSGNRKEVKLPRKVASKVDNLTKKRKLSASKENLVDRNLPIVERYAPENKSDLCVHKKKIEDVEKWFTQYSIGRHKNSVLLLMGPSGAGKSTTVKLLCQDKKMKLYEWQNPMNSTEFFALQEYILRVDRYGFSDSQMKPVILLDDLPPSCHLDSQPLCQLLHTFASQPRSALLILILSENSLDGRLRSKLASIIPHSINFNPISNTALKKLLQTVIQKEGKSLSVAAKADIVEQLIISANGDIRAALNGLEMQLANKTKTGTQADTRLSLFHSLGKILHAKRDNLQAVDISGLPTHLVNSGMARKPLNCDPEEVVEQSQLPSNLFLNFLHENYLSFLGEAEEALNASSYLSDAAVFEDHWMPERNFSIYCTSVASRGFLYSNEHRAGTGGWKPLHKPQEPEQRAKRINLKNKITDLWHRQSQWWMWHPSMMATDVLSMPNLCDSRLLALRAASRFKKKNGNRNVLKDGESGEEDADRKMKLFVPMAAEAEWVVCDEEDKLDTNLIVEEDY